VIKSRRGYAKDALFIEYPNWYITRFQKKNWIRWKTSWVNRKENSSPTSDNEGILLSMKKHQKITVIHPLCEVCIVIGITSIQWRS